MIGAVVLNIIIQMPISRQMVPARMEGDASDPPLKGEFSVGDRAELQPVTNEGLRCIHPLGRCSPTIQIRRKINGASKRV